jgi:hypothetical protein
MIVSTTSASLPPRRTNLRVFGSNLPRCTINIVHGEIASHELAIFVGEHVHLNLKSDYRKKLYSHKKNSTWDPYIE